MNPRPVRPKPRCPGALLALLLVVVVGAACSSKPAASSPLPSANSPAPVPSVGQLTYAVTYTLSGDVAASGTFTRPITSAQAPTCPMAAQKGNGFTQAGVFNLPTPLNDAYPLIEVTLSAYQGPGTVQAEAGGALTGRLMPTTNTPFYNVTKPDTNAALVVDPDGSGSFTFANARPVGPTQTAISPSPSPTGGSAPTPTPSGAQPGGLTGSIHWSCASG